MIYIFNPAQNFARITLTAAWNLWCSTSLPGMRQHSQTDRKVLTQLESLHLIHSGAICMWAENHINFSPGRLVQILHQETCCMKRLWLGEKIAMHSVEKPIFHMECKRVSWMLTSKSQVFPTPPQQQNAKRHLWLCVCVCRIALIQQGVGRGERHKMPCG